jgi:hypothetical protein
MNQLSQRDLELHVKILGWLHIACSGLLLLIGAFLLVFLPSIGAVVDDPDALAVLGIVGPALCFLLAGFSLPGLLTGYGLLKQKNWGRILALVVGLLNLLNFPIGTIVGIYTFWVLLQESAADYFMSLKAA